MEPYAAHGQLYGLRHTICHLLCVCQLPKSIQCSYVEFHSPSVLLPQRSPHGKICPPPAQLCSLHIQNNSEFRIPNSELIRVSLECCIPIAHCSLLTAHSKKIALPKFQFMFILSPRVLRMEFVHEESKRN